MTNHAGETAESVTMNLLLDVRRRLDWTGPDGGPCPIVRVNVASMSGAALRDLTGVVRMNTIGPAVTSG